MVSFPRTHNNLILYFSIKSKEGQWNELFDFITRKKLMHEIGEDGESVLITFTVNDEEHTVC
jgi:hypothetical protein